MSFELSPAEGIREAIERVMSEGFMGTGTELARVVKARTADVLEVVEKMVGEGHVVFHQPYGGRGRRPKVYRRAPAS